MAADVPDPAGPAAAVAPVVAARRSRTQQLATGAAMALALVLGLALLIAAVVESAIGRRIIADQLASLSTTSGLHVTIGRIEGSIFHRTTLDDVTVRDLSGAFLRAPVVELDWRPLAWFTSGIDIRSLTIRRAILLRRPNLRAGVDPNAPLLPDFNIRIDRLAVERLTIAKAVMGQERRIDLHARVDIGKRRALLALSGALGGGDRLSGLLDADRARNRFNLGLDYNAPRGGLLAALSGVQQGSRVRIGGRGDWHDWRGGVLAQSGSGPAEKQLAVLQLTNRDGLFGLSGHVAVDDLIDRRSAARLGHVLALTGSARLEDKVLAGRLGVVSHTLRGGAVGGIDLAHNALRQLAVTVQATDPGIVGPHTQLRGGVLHLRGDGPFATPQIDVTLTTDSFTTGATTFDRLTARGPVRRVVANGHAMWRAPLVLTTARVVAGDSVADPQLVGLHGMATLVLADDRLNSDDIALTGRGASARLALRGDLTADSYRITGHVATRGARVAQFGAADADASVAVDVIGDAWRLSAQISGRTARIDDAAVAAFAGGPIRFTGSVATAADQPVRVPHAVLTSPDVSLTVAGLTRADGTAEFTGSGRHKTYGPITFAAQIGKDGPHATVTLADPLPAAGLSAVQLAISPAAGGLHVAVNGNSMLGPFAGTLGLQTPGHAPARLAIEHLEIYKTNVTGALSFPPGGVQGTLMLAGGGVAGTIALSPRPAGQGGGQGLNAKLTMTDAHFGGAHPLTIGHAELSAQGLIAHGHTTLTADGAAQGIGRGSLFIGRLAARAKLVDGRGQVTASLGGRRGSRFDLQVLADVAPGRIAALANGSFAAQRILMPRRAVVTQDAAGWRLARTEVDFGGGRVIASGLFGGEEAKLDLALANMPLSLADVLVNNVGLGGTVSGVIDYTAPRGGAPSGDIRVMLKQLTRSGLALTSRPIDVALVGRLTANALETRAVLTEGGQLRGRMQARIAGLPATGALADRLRGGRLAAQLRYSGPADALWRLAGVDIFDLTGPIMVAADVAGSPDDPSINGTLASDALRLQSAVTGTDLSQLRLRGAFAGSRLVFSEMAGRTAGNGTVVGSGSVDLTGLSSGKGPGLDLKLGLLKAQVLNRPDLAATITGPLHIVSDGVTGTVAGRLAVDGAKYRMGVANAAAQLSHVPTREINRAADIAPAPVAIVDWHYLIDAAAPGRVLVQGQGIDSEWSARLRLRGALDNPAIGGEAGLITGSYEFAGKRFDLTRGRVSFDGSAPPDPRVDIAATADVNGLTATVTVQGSGLNPQIAFTSVPALPEEELLSRLLFGSSITAISAPEALQLATALASLHGGGGLDPINRLRSAIGLDRLRIVSPDTTIGRGTSVAAGKYLGRHLYAEVISDGKGYSATNLEFRLTRWLSLLGTVSTIGRQSVNAKVSHDY